MKTSANLVVGLILSLFVAASPVVAQPLEKSKGGKLACPGFHSILGDGSEITSFAYPLRNFNSDQTLTITNVTIYAADGTVVGMFPPFPVGFDNVLGPNETTIFNTQTVFGDAPPGPGLLQVIVDWTADGKGFDLFSHIVRIVRARNPGTGDILETRATAALRCVTLK